MIIPKKFGVSSGESLYTFLQSSKRVLRSNEILIGRNGLIDSELDLSFSLQVPSVSLHVFIFHPSSCFSQTFHSSFTHYKFVHSHFKSSLRRHDTHLSLSSHTSIYFQSSTLMDFLHYHLSTSSVQYCCFNAPTTTSLVPTLNPSLPYHTTTFSTFCPLYSYPTISHNTHIPVCPTTPQLSDLS